MTKSSELTINAAETRLLSAIGFMSARAGLVQHATKIFECIVIHRPQKSFGYAGLALSNLCVGSYSQAISILRDRGLKKLPGDVDLLAWLGIALFFSGEKFAALKIIERCKFPRNDSTISALLVKIVNNH